MDFLVYNMIGKMTINTNILFENHRIRQNQYFSYMHEVFLFFSVPIFSYKIKDILKYPVKLYCVDNGSIRVGYPKFSENLGRLAEKNEDSVHQYVTGRMRSEVDFVITEGVYVKQLIQVCWSVDGRGNKKKRGQNRC